MSVIPGEPVLEPSTSPVQLSPTVSNPPLEQVADAFGFSEYLPVLKQNGFVRVHVLEALDEK